MTVRRGEGWLEAVGGDGPPSDPVGSAMNEDAQLTLTHGAMAALARAQQRMGLGVVDVGTGSAVFVGSIAGGDERFEVTRWAVAGRTITITMRRRRLWRALRAWESGLRDCQLDGAVRSDKWGNP